MTWLIFLASTLACFRLTRLVTDDKIFEWGRSGLIKAAPAGTKKKVKEGIECPFCVSFWIASLITVGLALSTQETMLWLYQPAIWGGSVLWNQIFMKLTKEIK